MNYKSFIVITFAALILSSGCEKTKTPGQLLCAHEWKVQYAERITANGRIPEPIDDCRNDDYERFELSGTWKYFTGTKYCSANATYEEGKWQIPDKESKVLKITTSTGIYTGAIEELTETTFSLKSDYLGFSVVDHYIPVPQ